MSTVIKNARIIDCTGKTIENGFIEFDESGILEVSEKPLSGAVEIDGTGKTVMPGLIDCHVHLAMLEVMNGFGVIDMDNETMTAAKATAQCMEYLKFGVTTIKNMGTKFDSDIYIRNLIDEGLVTGPRIIASGQIIAITGGHGHGIALESDTPDEALKAARTLIKKGAQMLKLMATGGVLTKGSVIGAQQLTQEQMTVVAEEARRTGRITGAHCIGYEGTKAAILSGLDSIEHGYLLDEALIELMLERGTYLTPTIFPSQALAHSTVPGPDAEALRAKIAPIADGHQTAIAMAIKMGVKIAAGTDCGTPCNPVNHMDGELKWYVDLGMTNMQALMSGTKVASELIKLDKEIGTLEKGKVADVIVLGGNPLEDILQTSNVERTYRSGKLVYARGPQQ